jgi:hypothetical protein
MINKCFTILQVENPQYDILVTPFSSHHSSQKLKNCVKRLNLEPQGVYMQCLACCWRVTLLVSYYIYGIELVLP